MIRSLILSIIPFLFLSCLPNNADRNNLDIRSYMSGKNIYSKSCAQCHGNNGEGYKELYPQLVKDSLFIFDSNDLTCLISLGSKKKGDSENEEHIYMPANPELNSGHITDLINYIIEEWGQGQKFITLQEVKTKLNECN